MIKYQYSIYKKDTGDAGGKAKNDVFDILERHGFIPSYVPSDKQKIRVIQQLLSINKLSKGECIFVQYPAVHKKILNRLISKCQKVKYRIAIVHDIRSIQGFDSSIQEEMKLLSFFNYLIVHNSAMEEFVKSNGYHGTVIQLKIFDYLHDLNRQIDNSEYSGSICVAGNLDKSQYLSKLDAVDRYSFNLFGSNKTQDFSNKRNIRYLGLLPSDEIVYQLAGNYGLVWDGDSIEKCQGKYGEYLLYNSPHKLSLYLAAGKPIITWSKAAISDFVLSNEIGICVDSLKDLNEIDLETNYALYKKNAMLIKSKLANGEFLTGALEKIEGMISRE